MRPADAPSMASSVCGRRIHTGAITCSSTSISMGTTAMVWEPHTRPDGPGSWPTSLMRVTAQAAEQCRKEHNMGRLDGKVALISGGARGQGACEARMFCREGAKVVLGDILDAEGKTTEADIRAAGGEATYVHLNVTSEADWRAAVE